ncbi:M28 family metallopeptidase [Thalassotalea marina]|uniref:Peptidase M28 n=1 Tax=Thalassotalea marina TaxID=1673741 RepID=A0A919BHG4_9GAMM|nr:M28 family metallopeptidase [Thalassotalea marina]GHF92311.1 peptidase M28 [Thalassotalea marina]
MIKTKTILSALALCSAFAAQANDFDTAYNSFNKAKIKQDIKTLSSDAFEGREPSGVGEKMTTDMLIERFKALGLTPGNGNSFTQAVPMVSIVSTPTKGLQIADMEFGFLKNYVANSRKTQETIGLKDSELVFVGYGIHAPEYGWNDYKGLDVKGKTVVVLVNDPGYATQDPKLFEGNTMTYYGRWIYKYEEAARQGAAGAIIVHETAPASYGWNVIESSWSGAQYHLPAKEVNEPAIDVEMWITTDKAETLFKKAGLSFQDMKKQALNKSFKAKSLGLTANISLKNEIKSSTSNNVLATIQGSEKPDEHVVFMGHWDHLGAPMVNGEKVIYNGAHDNATGTAGLLHIAKAFQALGKKPKRSITFAAVTAEEQGRLGSRYFANHPSVPLNKIVGLINMDSLDITGLKTDVTVTGYGKSELETYLAEAAKRQNRTLVAEETPERGYYYRSDHFSLAKKGVPALSAGGGTQWLNANEKAIGERVSASVAKCYHQACDVYDENWGWDGLVAELQLFFETGYLLSESGQWPNWRQGTEFKAARDAMMK